jgi:DNA polymerase V
MLVRNPPATFLMRADTEALAYKGIFPDSLLLVDRSIKPVTGSLVVFGCMGEFHCREIAKRGNKTRFVDGDGNELRYEGKIILFGVVTKVINDV